MDGDRTRNHKPFTVDDMTILAPDNDVMTVVKEELKAKFNVTDMGEINHILGMKIERDWDKGTITLSQKPIHRRFSSGWACKTVNQSKCHQPKRTATKNP